MNKKGTSIFPPAPFSTHKHYKSKLQKMQLVECFIEGVISLIIVVALLFGLGAL